MPPINSYRCSNCDFAFPSGWGGYLYVEDDSGKRIPCAHPSEDFDVEEVLGISYRNLGLSVYGSVSDYRDHGQEGKWWWSRKRKTAHRENAERERERKASIHNLIRQRTGYNSYCVCLDCLEMSVLDLGDEKSQWRAMYGANRPKDERICTNCNSTNVKTVFELIGQNCPVCKTGTIEEIDSGLIT